MLPGMSASRSHRSTASATTVPGRPFSAPHPPKIDERCGMPSNPGSVKARNQQIALTITRHLPVTHLQRQTCSSARTGSSLPETPHRQVSGIRTRCSIFPDTSSPSPALGTRTERKIPLMLNDPCSPPSNAALLARSLLSKAPGGNH